MPPRLTGLMYVPCYLAGLLPFVTSRFESRASVATLRVHGPPLIRHADEEWTCSVRRHFRCGARCPSSFSPHNHL